MKQTGGQLKEGAGNLLGNEKLSGLAGALANVAIFIFVLALIAGVVLFLLGRKAAKSLSS